MRRRDDTPAEMLAAEDTTPGVEAEASDLGQSVGKMESSTHASYVWADTPGVLALANATFLVRLVSKMQLTACVEC